MNRRRQRRPSVTGGDDCPGSNAVIRAAAKAAAKRGWESISFLGGYEGILKPQRYMQLAYQQLGSLLTRGGTILDTANRGRFSAKVGHGETRRLPQGLIAGVKAGMRKLNIRALGTIFGAEAVELIAAGNYGQMVACLGSGVAPQGRRQSLDGVAAVAPASAGSPRRWRFG